MCAEELDVPPEQISVLTGDTAIIQFGAGTYGSRSAVTAGNAVNLAALQLRSRILDVASAVLSVPADRLTMRVGEW